MARRRVVSFTAGGLLALAAALVAIAGVATAHTPAASLTCVEHQPVLSIVLTNYNSGSGGTNTVSASIDGVSVLATTTFGGSYSHTLAAGSPFASHTAQVMVFAWDDPKGVNGWTKTFNLTAESCQTKTPEPTRTPEPTKPAESTKSPFQSFQGETATPVDPTTTPFQSFEGETATPAGTSTPPPTSTAANSSGGNSSPLPLLLICFAFAGAGLAAVETQRRSVRR